MSLLIVPYVVVALMTGKMLDDVVNKGQHIGQWQTVVAVEGH